MSKRSLRVSVGEALTRNWITPAQAKQVLVKPVATKKPRKADREGEAQAILLATFEVRWPEYADVLIHIPNGGARKNRFEGYRLKLQGVKKGVSDLFLPVGRGGFFGLWIEFKADPPFDAPVTDSQKDWVDKMRRNGYQAHICLGVEAAMEVLSRYLSLPATVQCQEN